MSLYSAYSVTLDGTALAGLTSLDSAANPEVDASVGIGTPFPQFAVVRAVKPQINFQTQAVNTVLSAIGVAGGALGTLGTLVANFVALADGAPTNAGRAYTMAEGLILPRQLTCAHAQDATLDVQAIGRSDDGTTEPMIAGAATIGSLVRDNIRHTLKSAAIAGVTFNDFTNVQVDFGVNAEVMATNSDIFPKHITKGKGITPKITVTSHDAAAIATLGLKGKRAAHADTSILLRQYNTSGVGFSASEDMELTMSGMAVFQTHSGKGNDISSITIEITGDWDGTNSPILLA